MKFTYVNILKLGQSIDAVLKEAGVTHPTEMTVEMPREMIKKVDEELYFGSHKGDDKHYTGSDEPITVSFQYFTMNIKPTNDEDK